MGNDLDKRKSTISRYSPLVYIVLTVSFFIEWWYFTNRRSSYFQLESDMKIEHEQLLTFLKGNSTSFFIVTAIIFGLIIAWSIASTISQKRFRQEQQQAFNNYINSSM